MTTITIIGTGNMGSAIASALSSDTTTIESIGHVKQIDRITGDIAILAVPYPALAEIAEKYSDLLEGKTVVDITNPVDSATFSPLAIDVGSAAAELAAALPSSTVLKAFNTNFAATLAAKAAGGRTTTVMVAGDDAEAKQALSAATVAGGLNVVDAGALARARELEAIGYLQMSLAVSEQIGWTDALGIIK